MPREHILLLENDRGLERVLILLLKQANFRVSSCRRMETFLARIRAVHTDLLIIDMPEKNCEGDRVLRYIKTGTIALPLIIITPYGNEALIDKADKDNSGLVLYSPLNLTILSVASISQWQF